MQISIKLRTIKDIHLFRKKVTGIKIQLVDFQKYTIRKFANLVITNAIHRKMAEAGFSIKIIRGTYLDNIEMIGTKTVRLFFRSEYFASTGFDVAVAREEGTRDHWIEGNPVLAFESGGPQSGNKKAIYSKNSSAQKGEMIFSKGHYVSGLEELRIVEQTVKQMTPALQDDYNKQQAMWYESNFGGLADAS